ncbi:gamma-glutamyltransferase [Nocardioides sp. Root122]|uniref:gamma-glutamyltransferase n=1 Tax=Nocardioides TaxID=1839 RepID=UPI000702A625|nr:MULTISPECIES: gamma-glutamyltransferase [Nocardioides]KQV77857.1 gamma-glutamyltransferase [Nocardioides sp. Root122]MCK9822339.1 gamma-glutamyltransferase [Nocardioides cavernae]
MHQLARPAVATLATAGLLLAPLVAGAAQARPGSSGQAAPSAPDLRPTAKDPTAIGKGGAITTVDPEASAAGLKVLKKGGNAVDAAVAAAATLGVTEPYSAGIGGGGYFVYYNAKSGKVRTLDGRETAPSKMPQDAFVDPATGKPYNFTPELVTSGVSVGTPGTLATWDKALANWGTLSLADALAPATKVATRGFKVDETFRQQTLDNEERFAAFKDTKKLFLPKGDAPAVGSVFRNPELAATYDLIADKGISAFYRGPLARLMSDVVRKPRTTKNTKLPVPKGYLTPRDLRDYRVRSQRATRTSYRGHDVYGMAPSSSGGTTVGEALNILERYDLSAMTTEQALHHYLEASALAFADRGAYVGDAAYVDVPVKRLLDDKYAAERACSLSPTKAATKPVAAGTVTSYDGVCSPTTAKGETDADTENISTTNLTVADRWGNVVEYTLTIEQTGGSGITVPGHGFLLNNELTDFSTTYDAADPNRIQPGKRPRSSMSPTIVLKDGKPFLALGSPGGSTIITTVLQMLVNRIDLGMSIEEAIAAPRATQRNTANVTAEPAFIAAYGTALTSLGHTLVPAGDAFTSAAEIGAATAIEFGSRSRLTAVAEPSRRGKGSARVVDPR